MGNGVVKGWRWMKMWPDKGMMYNKNMIDQTAYERGIQEDFVGESFRVLSVCIIYIYLVVDTKKV